MSITIPIGPYHPALKESAYVRLEVQGETIINADLKVGYNHRGVEWLATQKTYYQNIFLCERICGICSNIHSLTYCQTVEDVVGDRVAVPDRARYLRTIVSELERIHSHLLWFGVAMHEMGFDTAFMYIWRDREEVMRIIETIAGKRINYAFNTIGGTRRDIAEKVIKKTEERLDKIERSLDRIKEIVTGDRLIRERTKDIGILSTRDARKICVVGPTARASNIKIDVRKDDPYAAYSELDWNISVAEGGDVFSRVVVRLLEMYESLKIIREALKSIPDGPIVDENWSKDFPSREAFDRGEAPRGELFYYIKSDGTNMPERVKVRTPSVMNDPSLALMLIGYSVGDSPLIIASIDPCFSCTDRVAVVDSGSGKTKYFTLTELSRRR